MSIKIYDAYKVKDGVDLWPLLWAIRDQAREKAKSAFRHLYWKRMRDLNPEYHNYAELRELYKNKPEGSFRLRWVHDDIMRLIEAQVTKRTVDYYDVAVSVVIYPHKTGYYLRAVNNRGFLHEVLDFLEEHPDLEDFHYQNSGDKPEGISDEDWSHRKKVWDEIFCRKGFANYVSLTISEWGDLQEIDPWWELAKENHDKPFTFPSPEEVVAVTLYKLFPDVTFKDGEVKATDLLMQRLDEPRGEIRWTVLNGNDLFGHKFLMNAMSHIQLRTSGMLKEFADRADADHRIEK